MMHYTSSRPSLWETWQFLLWPSRSHLPCCKERWTGSLNEEGSPREAQEDGKSSWMFSPRWAPRPGSRGPDNMCPGRFQNGYRPVLPVVEWGCLLWLSCSFLTAVCLLGVEELGEVGEGRKHSWLSRSRGAASTSGHVADREYWTLSLELSWMMF